MHNEVKKAYRRAQEILKTHGCLLLLDISPALHASLPKKAYENIGIGAATGLWKGMHSSNISDCPFHEDWPIYGFWKAGFEYRTRLIAKGLYLA